MLLAEGAMNSPASASAIRIPAKSHLLHYLPLAEQAVGRYGNLMLSLGIDISKLGPREHLPVSEQLLILHIDELAACVRELSGAYGGVAPGSG